MAKRRKVAKDKNSGVPKKYLSGTSGGGRKELVKVLKQISELYRQGKKVPKSLLDKRIKLGGG